jgi:hypothetical protein
MVTLPMPNFRASADLFFAVVARSLRLATRSGVRFGLRPL